MAKPPFGLKPFYSETGLWVAHAQTNGEIRVLAESDGTIRIQHIGYDGNAQIRLSAETTGQLEISQYGSVTDGTITSWALDAGGVPKAVLYGKNASDAITALLTLTDGTLVVSTDEPAAFIQVDPQLVPAAEADLWDPAGDAGDIFDVEFLVVNIDAAASVDVTIGQDVAGGGSLADSELFMDAETVPSKASSGWRGPFRIGGDDHIRGVATAADDANIHFRIKRVTNV